MVYSFFKQGKLDCLSFAAAPASGRVCKLFRHGHPHRSQKPRSDSQKDGSTCTTSVAGAEHWRRRLFSPQLTLKERSRQLTAAARNVCAGIQFRRISFGAAISAPEKNTLLVFLVNDKYSVISSFLL